MKRREDGCVQKSMSEGLEPELSRLEDDKIEIRVYFEDGRVSRYTVATPEKAREHAHEIMTKGYREVDMISKEMTYYPVHKLSKVAFDIRDESDTDYLMRKYEQNTGK